MVIELTRQSMKNGFLAVVKWLRLPMGLFLLGWIISPHFWQYWRHVKPDGRLILGYISTMKWPVVVLIIFFLTRKYIPDVLESIEEVTAGKFGAKFHKKTEQDTESPDLPSEGKEPAQDNPSKTAEADLDKLLTSEEANEAYENILSAIYGTQLMILKRLFDNVPNGLLEHQLYDIFKAHKRTDPNPYPSLLHLLQFLLDNSLILLDQEDRHYKITNAGVYFLRYLSGTGRYSATPAN